MLFSVLLFSHLLYGGHGYDYENFLAWGDESEICISGKNQSPIDLRAVPVIRKNDNSLLLQFKNYNVRPQSINVTHEGYTVSLRGDWKTKNPEVSGPDVLLGDTYYFNNFHLHWSNDNDNGTEHSINGKKYAAEVHLLHDNKDDAQDGLMISVLYYVNDAVAPNSGMELFASYVKSTTEDTGKIFDQPQFDLSQLLPNPVESFYSYNGSAVVPPCTENIRWIVMAEPQPINTQIINTLRKVPFTHDSKHNIRPLQATNDRLVEFYKQNKEKSLLDFIKMIISVNKLQINNINYNINS